MADRINSRELVCDSLMEILEKGNYSHLVLNQALGKYQFLSKADRALVTRITEGTLEYLIQIDEVLNQYSRTRVDKMKPVIRTILRMSVYQILYLDRIPPSAACNEAVKLAEKRKFIGLKGFVNGVLRSVSRDKEKILSGFSSPSIQYSAPEWLVELWKRELGESRMETVLRAGLSQSATMVRCNVNLVSMEEIQASLTAQGVSFEVSPYSKKVLLISDYDYLENLDAFLQGWVQVQDVSSVLAGEAASPREGDFILDVCAAPGGKSLHMADLLHGTGMVEARDLTWSKVEKIEENIRRSGYENIRAKCQDARIFDLDSVEKADILFADLPCSGLGVIGRKPDIKLHMTPEKMEELSRLQREILSVVWQYVKPGGKLIYSTCTIHSKENQENVRWLLDHHPFTLVDISSHFPENIREESMKEGWMQFLPGIHLCDGFFVAVLQRNK